MGLWGDEKGHDFAIMWSIQMGKYGGNDKQYEINQSWQDKEI